MRNLQFRSSFFSPCSGWLMPYKHFRPPDISYLSTAIFNKPDLYALLCIPSAIVNDYLQLFKKNIGRSNFAELTLGGQKFVFDSVEAIFDTSAQGTTSNFRVYDPASNSNMMWETVSGSKKWINGTYEYPGELFPGRSVVFLSVQTYINRVPGTYSMQNNLTLTIDQSENGRIHGTFSGKITCYTCTPYGAEVSITNGEFEMPYSYR